jgi:hypothetical protein
MTQMNTTPTGMTQMNTIPPQVWRQNSAPETVGTVSQSFLVQLAARLGLKTDVSGPSAEITIRDSSQMTIIMETVDYDCRIGEKGRKRRREAQKVKAQKVKKASGQATGTLLVLGRR